MARKYHQGIFNPKNPQKYVGNAANIVYRSSWELKFMKWADTNPSVLYWNSEEMIVPYLSPVDNAMHRYFVDFIVQVKTISGVIKNYAVEIKPDAQTKPPKQRSRVTKSYINEVKTYSVNQAKWAAADVFCKKRNMDFVVLTEKHLF